MSVVLLGSTSGSVTLQEPAIAGSTVIDLPATSGTMAVLPTATSVLPEASGGTGTTTGYYGFKNRLINGSMVIDQRNAGASVTPSTASTAYVTVDRWKPFVSQGSKLSLQQNAGAVTPPAGFGFYLGVTSLSAYSITSTDYFALNYRIEGFNTADLNWGTANAQTVTLSFWIRSSLTGTFGGSILNSAENYSYPFTYTISAANTWEQKTITIAGPTAGTWIGATNGIGLQVFFGMGVGSTYSGTAGAWASSGFIVSATGATSVVGTNGATFYITGVQLEKGSTATSFDYRPYGTELALCQRYYQNYGKNANAEINGACNSTIRIRGAFTLPVVMRASGTLTTTGTPVAYSYFAANPTLSTVNTYSATATTLAVDYNVSSGTVTAGLDCAFQLSGSNYWELSSEL